MGEPVESVKDGFVGAELGDGQTFERSIQLVLFVPRRRRSRGGRREIGSQ